MHPFTSRFQPLIFPHHGMVRLPEVHIPEEQRVALGLSPTSSNLDFLTALARKGYMAKASRISAARRKEYGDRVKRELATFEELAFTDYVLLVWMVINKAREMGVFIDYGRGSCAASCVFWLLGITGVDPIQKGLLFERFVSKVRSKKQVIDGKVYLQGDLIADADLNLGNGRKQIVDWLKTIYPNRVCKIVTHMTFTSKVLVVDVYKTMCRIPEEEARRVSAMLESKYGIVDDIEDTYKKHEGFKTWADQNPKVYAACLHLRDLIRQTGIHASGYVIACDDFDGTLPLALSKGKGLMSAYDMQDVCNYAVKLDLLGLSTCRIIKDVIDATGVNPDSLNLQDDPVVYDSFQNDKWLPYGLYQISARTAMGVTRAIKPKSVDELSDVNAIARPGALAYLDGYVKGDHACPHPLFETILKPTRNYCLYQEQLMQMAVAIGFSPDDAETLRKIVGKKLVDKMPEWKDKVYAKVAEGKLPTLVADVLWKVLDDSANYSFNLAHSLGVSYLGALTAYLKFKHPVEFYWACLRATKPKATLNDDDDDEDDDEEGSRTPSTKKRTAIIAELPRAGVKLLPPDLLRSGDDFTIEGRAIRFGLSHIKGISSESVVKMTSLKRDFTSKFEAFKAAAAAKINIGTLAHIISAGCLNVGGDIPRAKLVFEAQLYNELTDKEKKLVDKLAYEFNYDLIAIVASLKTRNDEKGKPLIKESRLATLQRDYAPYWQMYQQNSRNAELCDYIHERHLLGFSYSGSLHGVYSKKVKGLLFLSQVADLPAPPPRERGDPYPEPIKFVAFVEEAKRYTSQKDKTPYLRMSLFDDSGSIKAMLYGEEKVESCRQFNSGLPEENDIVIVSGSKTRDGTMIFCDSVIKQHNPIATKKAQAIKAAAAQS